MRGFDRSFAHFPYDIPMTHRETLMGINKVALLITTVLLAGPLAAVAQEYTVKNLGTLGGTSSIGYGINTKGQVTGVSATTGDAVQHAFLYSDGRMQDLGTPSGTNSYGYGINASAQVTGVMEVAAEEAEHAFLNSNGTMQDLGTLGGTNSEGYAAWQPRVRAASAPHHWVA
jgi:probable HAF family extracellular repeat protein